MVTEVEAAAWFTRDQPLTDKKTCTCGYRKNKHIFKAMGLERKRKITGGVGAWKWHWSLHRCWTQTSNYNLAPLLDKITEETPWQWVKKKKKKPMARRKKQGQIRTCNLLKWAAGVEVIFSKQTQGGWMVAVITGRWRTTHPCRRRGGGGGGFDPAGQKGFSPRCHSGDTLGHHMCHHHTG